MGRDAHFETHVYFADTGMTPNRVNRAHWPTKENSQKFTFVFLIFLAHAKKCLGGPQMGRGRFFPANPGLADILGGTDFDFEKNVFFLDFLDPRFLDFQIPAFPDSKLSSSYICPRW